MLGDHPIAAATCVVIAPEAMQLSWVIAFARARHDHSLLRTSRGNFCISDCVHANLRVLPVRAARAGWLRLRFVAGDGVSKTHERARRALKLYRW
jgi:hypothetical protein